MEWYGFAALGILTAFLSFLMDLSVLKLLKGTHIHIHAVTYVYSCEDIHRHNTFPILIWTIVIKCLNQPSLTQKCLHNYGDHRNDYYLPLVSLAAHQWLYMKLEGNSLLQFFCWTLYPACLCVVGSTFSHHICPFSTGLPVTTRRVWRLDAQAQITWFDLISPKIWNCVITGFEIEGLWFCICDLYQLLLESPDYYV